MSKSLDNLSTRDKIALAFGFLLIFTALSILVFSKSLEEYRLILAFVFAGAIGAVFAALPYMKDEETARIDKQGFVLAGVMAAIPLMMLFLSNIVLKHGNENNFKKIDAIKVTVEKMPKSVSPKEIKFDYMEHKFRPTLSEPTGDIYSLYFLMPKPGNEIFVNNSMTLEVNSCRFPLSEIDKDHWSNLANNLGSDSGRIMNVFFTWDSADAANIKLNYGRDSQGNALNLDCVER